MLDIENAKKVFQEYVDSFDKTQNGIRLKNAHTYRVADLIKTLAESISFSDEEIELAELIGLLHDIGRFEQLKRYHTFLDSKSIDHAKLGVKILFEDGLIRKFIQTEEYDRIIKIAVDNHNKLKIEPNLSEKELVYCRLIRDADKIDIFYNNTTENRKIGFQDFDQQDERISDTVLETFKQGKQIENSKRKYFLDAYINMISFIYDLNFMKSFEIIKEKGYINCLVNQLELKDEKAKRVMEEIKKTANEYIENRIKEDV